MLRSLLVNAAVLTILFGVALVAGNVLISRGGQGRRNRPLALIGLAIAYLVPAVGVTALVAIAELRPGALIAAAVLAALVLLRLPGLLSN